ncbi:MAG: hypothetical protein MJA83_14435, partial [Gammaproteobacteria bacterium]|nr:hypothetical protein [Gammaproteobacteria bacterium]
MAEAAVKMETKPTTKTTVRDTKPAKRVEAAAKPVNGSHKEIETTDVSAFEEFDIASMVRLNDQNIKACGEYSQRLYKDMIAFNDAVL